MNLIQKRKAKCIRGVCEVPTKSMYMVSQNVALRDQNFTKILNFNITCNILQESVNFANALG